MAKEVQRLMRSLQEIRKKENQIVSDIKKYCHSYAEKNRQFQRGEVVSIYNAINGKFIGHGMVDHVRNYIHTDYPPEDLTKIERDFTRLIYEIYAIKKDGTASSKHFFKFPHFIGTDKERSNDSYITKKKEDE